MSEQEQQSHHSSGRMNEVLPTSELLSGDLLFGQYELKSKDDLELAPNRHILNGIARFKEEEQQREALELHAGQQAIETQVAELPNELREQQIRKLRRGLNARLVEKYTPGIMATDEVTKVQEAMQLELVRHKDFPNPVIGFVYRVIRDEDQNDLELAPTEGRIYFSTNPIYEKYKDEISQRLSGNLPNSQPSQSH